MLQDIAPHIYHNQMSWKEPEADDFVLCYRGRTLYCKVEDGSLVLPRVKDVEPSALQYAFSIDERADYLLGRGTERGKWLSVLRHRQAPHARARTCAHGCGSRGKLISLVQWAAVLRQVRKADGKEQDRAGNGLPCVRQHRLPQNLPGGDCCDSRRRPAGADKIQGPPGQALRARCGLQ